jgi:hypothetical protein
MFPGLGLVSLSNTTPHFLIHHQINFHGSRDVITILHECAWDLYGIPSK